MSRDMSPLLKQNDVSASEAEYLRTDHLLHNIGRRAVSGGFVTVAAQAAKFALTLAGTAILARLLSPREYGLVGMVLGVVGVVGIFNELGLSTATVQRQNITQQQVSNLFWINVAVSGIVTAAGCGLASLLAGFYRDPRVTWIMVALSLMFLLTGSTVQHRALLARQMRFRAVAVIDVTSMFVGFTTACVLAWLGFAYWALVAQQLVYSLACLVLTWSVSKWRPDWPSRNSGVRPLLSFGAHLTAADFVVRSFMNTDNILIGKFFGAVPLGLYTRASVLLARPLDFLVSPIAAVMDPVLARLQADPERYRRTFLRTFEGLALIIFPFSAICLALSRPMVLVIFGPKWTGVVPLFSAYALVAISGPLSNLVTWLYQSQGRGKHQLWNHSAVGVMTLIAYVVGLNWGPLGLILSLALVSAIIKLPIVFYIGGRSGPVSTGDLWLSFFSQLPAWGTAYVATSLARIAVANSSPVVQLLVCAPTGFLVGSALMLPFRRCRENVLFAFDTLKDVVIQEQRARMSTDLVTRSVTALGDETQLASSSKCVAKGGGRHTKTASEPLVSILMPAFNAQEWIADSIRSAIAQTWKSKEIIVVDDGSTDQTLSIARQFESESVRVVTQRQQGAAAARNKAFSLSRGDYIQWLDADDLLAPDKVARQMEVAQECGNKRVLLSSSWGKFMYRHQKAKFTPTELWCDLSPSEWLLRKMRGDIFLQTACWLVSRELTEAAGRWDPRLLVDDDGEYFCRVLLASEQVRFVPEAKVYYRGPALSFNSLSYIDQSARKIEAQWLSMQLHMRYLRAMQDGERVRQACLTYMQTWLLHFYPERRDILEQAEGMARELGGLLGVPRLSWKYSWMRAAFGWHVAKVGRRLLLKSRWKAEQSWEHTVFSSERMAGKLRLALSQIISNLLSHK